MEPQTDSQINPVEPKSSSDQFAPTSGGGRGEKRGLILGLIILALVIVAATVWYYYFMFEEMTTYTPPQVHQSAARADDATQALEAQGTSDEVSAIETDLNLSNYESLDAELGSIDSEL